jgi:hypothetical protein
VIILLEMVEAAARQGHASYTEWLARPLTPAQLAKLSPADKKARRRAQSRSCRHRRKLADLLADVARRDAKLAPGRDIVHLSPVLIDV